WRVPGPARSAAPGVADCGGPWRARDPVRAYFSHVRPSTSPMLARLTFRPPMGVWHCHAPGPLKLLRAPIAHARPAKDFDGGDFVRPFLLAGAAAVALGGCTTSMNQGVDSPAAAVTQTASVPDNILLQDWAGPYDGVPPFDQVRPELFGEALEYAID